MVCSLYVLIPILEFGVSTMGFGKNNNADVFAHSRNDPSVL